MNPYEFINQFKKYGKKGGFKPGLKRVKKLLSYFDNPQDKVDSIHIGGSNGKGSTAAILRSILMEAGYVVGTYISPPLVHFNERFTINKIPISTVDLQSIVSRLKEVFEDKNKDINLKEPSFFEIITVIAFIYFYEKDIDIGLLEVGLGGRLDATNIIKNPLLSIITNISCEHAEILGPKIEDIAYEKSGIIKEKTPIISGVDNNKALQVIKNTASKKESELVTLNSLNNYDILKKGLNYQTVNLEFKSKTLKNVRLNILGSHQVKNAALALKSLEYLPQKYKIKEEDIYKGLSKCSWPGRLEVINRKPDIILDGAHNEDGMRRFIDFLKENISIEKKIIFILSILKEKNYKGMLDLINNIKNETEIIITKNNNERSLPPTQIKKYVDELKIKNAIYPDIYNSVKTAKDMLKAQDVLCVTGSLYTVSEARFYLHLVLEGGFNNG